MERFSFIELISSPWISTPILGPGLLSGATHKGVDPDLVGTKNHMQGRKGAVLQVK